MFFSSIVRLFSHGDVCVTGLRGTGKDMLTSNVVCRRKLPYVSNVSYGGKYIPYDYKSIDVNNTYENFVTGNVNFYKYPYSDGTDIYISDAGIYYPSQYCSELNRKYKSIPVFMALSRHIGNCNVHINVQNLNRCWDKIREQSDIYILCLKCKVIGSLVIQRIRIYERYQSCVDRVPPCRVRLPLFGKSRHDALIYRDKFDSNYGLIKEHTLIYINKSNYDTRFFKKLLEGGV